MPEPDQANRVIRFGVFEADLHTLELRKQGVRVRVPQQSFQVLEALLRRPGELVTRKELKEKLWPSDSFGDFEHGLNAAVNRLREALGDSSDNPRFIETLPRRGYRFLAPVNGVPQSTIAGVLEDGGKPPAFATAEVPQQSRWQTSPSMTVLIATLVTGSVLALIGIATFLRSRQKKTTSPPESRLITSFGFAPVLSRDGKLLAYSADLGDGGSHILVQQTAGGEAIPLTNGPVTDVASDFSPDGTHIAFSSTRDGGGIYIIPTLRGEPRALVINPHAKFIEASARFSPAGDILLFVLDEKAFTVSIDSGRPVALPLNQKFLVYGPALWAPGGKEVLFYGVRRDEQSKLPDWWIVPLSTGQARQPNLPGIERNLNAPLSVRSWFRAADGREWLVYSTSDPAGWKIWRARVSPQGTTDESPELVTSGNGTLEYVSSVSEDGKLSYNTVSVTMSLHQISMGDRGQKTGPTVQLPLPEGGNYTSPSVSWDGKKMVYVIANPTQPNLVMLRDLTTGIDHLVDDKGRRRGAIDYTAEIAPDGSTVIFERDCKQGTFPEDHMSPLPCSFTVSAAGGEPEQICERCSPHGFSSDGSVVLFNKFDPTDGNRDRIVSMNLRTRSEQDFLSDPKQSLYNANLSWDKRWVVFRRASTGDLPPSQILIAPLLNGVAAGAADWIAVTNTGYSDDQPRFSPDGNMLYFTSDRDGYLCIWTQRLDPLTKHPVGAPVAYEHFHNAAGHDGISEQRFLYLSFARDKILLELMQGRSDLWMTKME